ncbi:MAG: PASTA domain-containing protein [Saprospiraceae bacterium]|nr:PASTA domain-containing protein [Saprospiraceae bacterium]
MSDQNKSSFKFTEIPGFLTSRLFGYNLIRLGIFLILIWILHSLILSIYTNHGQKVKLANYIGQPLEKVKRLAAAKDYDLIITDSIHLIGKPGGYVLNQTPKPNSMVKRGRSIYLVISRYKADEIISDNLPTLYGEKFDFKARELESLFQLKLRVSEQKFDPGPSGHILAAYYKGKLIANDKGRELGIIMSKGDTIEIVISTDAGGEIDVPNLRCKTLAEVRFETEASKINIGVIQQEGIVENMEEAYVIAQSPAFEKSKKIKIQSTIDLTVSSNYPDDCPPR